MILNRRTLIQSAAATALVPAVARAAGHASDVMTANGKVSIHPVSHASFVMETPAGVIYVDPVGEPSAYADKPPADLILVTHEHGDHFNNRVLEAVKDAPIVINQGAHRLLEGDLSARATEMANGDSIGIQDVSIEAVPAYNITEERKKFHPQGRDNGYVLTLPGNFRVYISGDTEDIPEMRGLDGIDLAFVCMNLPFTMDVTAAASAVNEFAPTVVYPYHYRGRDGGTQDPEKFAEMIEGSTEVRLGKWY